MTILENNNIQIGIRATNLARLFFVQEFTKTLDDTLLSLKNIHESEIYISLMKITWAMNKAENYYNKISTPTFKQWLKKYDGFNFDSCAEILFNEIKHGFTYKSSQSSGGQTNDKDLPQIIISIALKMGMSLDEINELTTQSLLDIFKVHMGKESDKKENRRFATPQEISERYGK